MATIVACLAATTSFASCDKTNGVEDALLAELSWGKESDNTCHVIT